MSYVLQVWEKPSTKPWPTTIEEAAQLVGQLGHPGADQNPKFLDFAKRLTERYPCICSVEADNIPESELAWSDGPLDGKAGEAVYSIGLNTNMLEEVRPFVFNTAKVLGLNVTDEQAGEVCLANGKTLSIRPIPMVKESPAESYENVPKCRDLQQIIFERLLPFMAKHGYKARKSSQSFKCTFPNGWHEIFLSMTDRWPLQVQFSFGVSSRFHEVSDLVASMTMPRRSPEEIKLQTTTVLAQKNWMDGAEYFIQGPNREYVINCILALARQ